MEAFVSYCALFLDSFYPSAVATSTCSFRTLQILSANSTSTVIDIPRSRSVGTLSSRFKGRRRGWWKTQVEGKLLTFASVDRGIRSCYCRLMIRICRLRSAVTRALSFDTKEVEVQMLNSIRDMELVSWTNRPFSAPWFLDHQRQPCAGQQPTTRRRRGSKSNHALIQ